MKPSQTHGVMHKFRCRRAVLFVSIVSCLVSCLQERICFLPTQPMPLCRARSRRLAFPWDRGNAELEERVYQNWRAEKWQAAAKGSFFGEPCDQATVIDRFQNLCSSLGRELAEHVVVNEPNILLFRKESVAESWRLMQVLEAGSTTAGQDLTASDVVWKNPALLMCEAYSLSGSDLSQLDSQSNIIAAMRKVGLRSDQFPTLITIGMILILSGGRALLDAGLLTTKMPV